MVPAEVSIALAVALPLLTTYIGRVWQRSAARRFGVNRLRRKGMPL